MEPVAGDPETPGEDGFGLLTLPGSCPWEDDDEPLCLGGIKPKSSPVPRRRNSETSCSDDDSQPPPSSSRRVSFADAFGLSLVSVKQFDSWAICGSKDPLERDLGKEKDHFLTLLFTPPQTLEELLWRVREQKLELESLELLPGTTTLKGIVRVLNLCFDKLVFIRMSLDRWNSHFDLLAEYVPCLSDGDTDSFSFKLTLVPPFGRQGVRVDFCLRYDTPLGSFWANNNGQNYVLLCCEKEKEQDEDDGKYKRKSCLKSTSLGSSFETSTSNTDGIPEITLNCGMALITEPVQKEKIQDDCMTLQEENSRNRNKRTKRRAERLAKVQQYFAERDDTDLEQTEVTTGEGATMTNAGEGSPAKGEESSNASTPEANAAREMEDGVSSVPATPMTLEGQEESTSGSVDTDNKQVPVFPIQILDVVNIPVGHPELTAAISQTNQSPTDSVNNHAVMESSVSQALDCSQDKHTLTSQTVSVTQNLPSSDISVSKCVEKAWECFEKCAVERNGSGEDTRTGEDTNTGGGKDVHEDNVTLENNPAVQSFGQTFTFETVVAPFYHQVFERIETVRRDLMNKGVQAHGPAGNLENGSLMGFTYHSSPRRPHQDTRPNVRMSEKHVVSDDYHGACKEPFPQDLLNATNTANKPLFDPSLTNKFTAEMEDAHNVPSTDMTGDPRDANMSELKIPQTVTHTNEGLLLQQEHPPNSTPPSWEEQTYVLQTVLQKDSTSEDFEYSLPDMFVQREYSSENSQQEPKPVDCVTLTAQPDLDSTTTKTSLSTISENLAVIGGSISQTSLETRFSTDIAKVDNIHQKATALTQAQGEGDTQTLEGLEFTKSTMPLQHSSQLQEDGGVSTPHPLLLLEHASSHMVPDFGQCDATPLFQNVISEASIHTQTPAATAHAQNQITEGANQTEQSDNMQSYTNDDSHRVCRDLESDVRNAEIDCERKNAEISFHSTTSETEKSHINPEKTTTHVILLNPQHISHINENKEHGVLETDFSPRVMGFIGPLDEDKALLIVNNNDNAEGSSTAKACDMYEDNEQVMLLKDHHSMQLLKETQEASVVENQEEEEEEKAEEEEAEEEGGGKEQQEPQEQYDAEEEKRQENSEKNEHEQREHHEKDQQENHEEIQLCNDDKYEDELQYIDDDEAEEIKIEKNTGQNIEEQENDDHDSLEVETDEQNTVSEVRSVVVVESHTNVREEHQSEYSTLEQRSDEPMGGRCSISGIEDISWKTDSSQQTSSQNHNTTCSGKIMLLENSLDSTKLINRERQLPCQTDKHQSEEGEVDLLLEIEDMKKQEKTALNEQSENNDDSASTESLTDDEMDLYLHSLKNTQQVCG
ncbi:uncharacterized protein ppp1r3ab isoform X2 [Brachyhypopomus gauderio]|uniref:uncharacterized protein ppp1r3ab isoform X2 n=1 Tax=Brachyhypopomus gauderio TaxID=698409 RepID=UPI004042E4DE